MAKHNKIKMCHFILMSQGIMLYIKPHCNVCAIAWYKDLQRFARSQPKLLQRLRPSCSNFILTVASQWWSTSADQVVDRPKMVQRIIHKGEVQQDIKHKDLPLWDHNQHCTKHWGRQGRLHTLHRN